MTVTIPPHGADTEPRPFCALCGRPMAPDQEWCLECGAARTVIARPPDWRVPLLVAGAVVLVIAALFVVALTSLTNNAGTITVIRTTAPRGPSSPIASWQPGLDGYTVILASEHSQAAAESAATKLLGAPHISDIGVLATSQHPQMAPAGVWDVFSGRYPSYALAQAAAAAVAAHGQPQARPALVQRPGQG